MMQYRPTASAAAVTSISPMSSLIEGASAFQANGSLTVAYDGNANTTTITIQNSTDQAQMVLPINLQQVFSDQDAKVAAGTLVLNAKAGTSQTNLFSGTVGSNTYQGKLVTCSGLTIESFTAYQFQNGSGKVILYAQANNGGVLNVRIPGGLAAAGPFGPAPAGSVLPPSCGSGTYTQTKNGSTVSGTFQPFAFRYLPALFDGSQDAYWSTH